MDSITLPVWQFIGAVALPSILLVMLVGRLLAVKRRIRENSAARMDRVPMETAGTYDHRIYQEMVSQQIDSVFNALNAVIEAERIKLKALLLRKPEYLSSLDNTFQTNPQDLIETAENFVHDLTRPHGRDRDHDHGSDEGSSGREHISRNEAALATMLRRQTAKKRHGVQAVA